MKKRIIALSMISLLSLGALSGCNVNKKVVNGEKSIVTIGDKEYTADDLFAKYQTTTSGASAYYNAIYDILVKHQEKLITTELKSIVDTKIDEFTQKAKDNASENGTTYKTELSTLLDEQGVDSLSELREIYTLEQQKEALEDQFYDDNMDALTLEYSRKKAPYHISHILVKMNDATSSLYDTHISADDAISLGAVCESLADSKISFGQVAKEMSDDNEGSSSSANLFGDLGIMDLDTSFVPEFKYSVFAYDAFMSSTATAKTGYTSVANELGLDKEFTFGDTTISLSDALSSVNEIPFSVTQYLGSLTDDTPQAKNNAKTYVDSNGKTRDVDESSYPRNIVFNQYFNDHGISVITNDTGTTGSDDDYWAVVPGLSSEEILCADKEGKKPILVTRASASYEGVHFIIIDKSPFELTDEQFLKYYDTTVPSSTVDASETDTFVTAIASNRDTYKTRSDSIKSKVKGFDSYLSYRIYENLIYKNKVENGKEVTDSFEIDETNGGYKLDDSVKISQDIKLLIQKYIDSQRENSKYSNEASTNSALKDYAQSLALQDAEEVKKLKLADVKDIYTVDVAYDK